MGCAGARDSVHREARQTSIDNSPDDTTLTEKMSAQDKQLERPQYRRVNFHYIVKDKNYLLWSSDLLDGFSRSQIRPPRHHTSTLTSSHASHRMQEHLNIHLPLLARMPSHIRASYFRGHRADLAKIMDEHYEMMLKVTGTGWRRRVWLGSRDVLLWCAADWV